MTLTLKYHTGIIKNLVNVVEVHINYNSTDHYRGEPLMSAIECKDYGFTFNTEEIKELEIFNN